MDPVGAGHEAARRRESWTPNDIIDSAIAEVLWADADRDDLP